MLSHVSPWRLSSSSWHYVSSRTCQAPATRAVLKTTNSRVQTCHRSPTLACAREYRDASRSREAAPSWAGRSDLATSRHTAHGTLISNDVTTAKTGQNSAVLKTSDGASPQKSADSTLKSPKHGQSPREPVADSPQSDLLPYVQQIVKTGNLFNPLLANFIRQIESREERTAVVGQILPILQSLVTKTGIELDFARRRRPGRVEQLQKKYRNAQTGLKRVEALAHQLQAPIAEIDEVTSLFHDSGELDRSINWNVPGLQRSTRYLGEKGKEKVIAGVLRALHTELSMYKRIGTKSNLKAAIDNLSSIKSWVLSQQKRGNLGDVDLEPAQEPNRFTGLVYPNKTAEADDLKKWQATQRQELSAEPQVGHDNIRSKDSKAHLKLQRGRDLKDLQIYMVSLYLEGLQLDDIYQKQTEQQMHEFEEQGRDSRSSESALGCDVALLEDLPNVPYGVHHYIFDQVLHEIQLVMFEKGQREFKPQMALNSWNSVENVPVVDFVKVMRISGSGMWRIDFCEEELRALRVLRNSHAHQLCDSDLRQLRALISAMCVLVRAIDPSKGENALLHNYRKLLTEYERLVIPELLRTRQAARKRYSDLTARHEAVQTRLDHSRMTPQGTRQSQGEWKQHVDKQKTADHNSYCRRMEATAKQQRKVEQDIMLRLASSLQDFTYEMQVRRALRRLPEKSVPRLLQKLQQEVSSGSGVLKTTELSAQSEKEQPEVGATAPIPQGDSLGTELGRPQQQKQMKGTSSKDGRGEVQVWVPPHPTKKKVVSVGMEAETHRPIATAKNGSTNTESEAPMQDVAKEEDPPDIVAEADQSSFTKYDKPQERS